MELQKLANNLSTLDLNQLAFEVLESMEDYLADLNREQMADKGQRSDGSDLEPDYSGTTEVLKRSKSGTSGITSHVTLYDTGDLHKSIFTSITDDILLDSKDSKVFDLEEKYGEFLGLTDESIEKAKEEFNKRFVPLFYERILQ